MHSQENKTEILNNNQIWNYLQDYLSYCEVFKNFSKLTIKTYKSSLKVFIADTKANQVSDITYDLVYKFFFNGRTVRKWSPVTYRHYLKHLNCLFRWLEEKNLIATNFCTKIDKPRLETKIPRTLNLQQAQTLLDYAYNIKYAYKCEKYRNRALIGIMLFAGLRRSEVIKLKISDVSLETRTIFINQGKGSKDRMIPINRKLYQYLWEYLNERRKQKHADLPNFFIGLCKHEGLQEKGISNLISQLRKKSKIYFSSHALRHSFATLMLEGGCDIYTLSKIMGHSKITTTTIYLTCSTKQMAKSIELHSLTEQF